MESPAALAIGGVVTVDCCQICKSVTITQNGARSHRPKAVPRRADEAAAARAGPDPDADGRGPRRLAQLPEPPGAQPAAGDRPGAAAAGRGLRPRPEDALGG